MRPYIFIFLSLLFLGAGEIVSMRWARTGQWRYVFLTLLVYMGCTAFWLPAIRERSHLSSLGTIWNIGAVVITVLIGVFVFREEVSPTQWLGIILAFVACVLLSH